MRRMACDSSGLRFCTRTVGVSARGNHATCHVATSHPGTKQRVSCFCFGDVHDDIRACYIHKRCPVTVAANNAVSVAIVDTTSGRDVGPLSQGRHR